MITLFTGMPGAGKTAALVDYLSKLGGDRPMFVDGLNGLTLPHTPCDATKWHDELPDGAILIIDEVQRVWRPRGSSAKVPDSVAALETHRHRGIDVYCTTQAPSLLDANVRNLVGRHIHIRDTGILGRHWYEWPEVNTAMAWKTCVNKRGYKLPKSAFALYKSSSLHTVPVRGIPRAVYVGAVALLALGVLVYLIYNMLGRVSGADKKAIEPVDITQSTTMATGQTSGMPTGSMVRLINDQTDWIPRISNKPESAPAYDHLRVVVAMPQVVGGMCVDDNCRCITQQGTDAGLASNECRDWLKNPPFNPYRLPTMQTAQNPAQATPAENSQKMAQL